MPLLNFSHAFPGVEGAAHLDDLVALREVLAVIVILVHLGLCLPRWSKLKLVVGGIVILFLA